MARSPRKRPKSSSVAVLLLLAAAACNRETAAPPPKAESKPTPAATASAAATTATDSMPSYSAKLLDGQSFDIAAQKGSPVLLNVWATWCEPCRFETPELQAFYAKYKDRGLKVVGVSVDEGGAEAEIKKFVAQNKVGYPIAVDPDGQIASILRTTVLPTTVLIDKNGRIVWRRVGPITPNETAAVEAEIEKAL